MEWLAVMFYFGFYDSNKIIPQINSYNLWIAWAIS